MRSIQSCVCVVCGLLLHGWFTLGAPLTLPAPQLALGTRMPALSPDGQRLAFVYQGDIWIVPSAGGRARPLTWHVEMDGFPLFSPDGQWIAFGSKRNGNWDIFLVPAEGGPMRQLTYHAADEIPQGWSPDGNKILFTSKTDGLGCSLFELDVRTLHLTKRIEDYSSINFPSFSPDGQWIVYGRNGFHWTRPRYVGSAAAQIWLCNLATGKRQELTHDAKQHLWTRFMPNGAELLTVTIGEPTPSAGKMEECLPKITETAARTPNLWLFDRAGHGRQKTFFVDGSVRAPTVAADSGDIAFEYEQDLWLLPHDQEVAHQVKIYAFQDEKQNTRRHEKLTYGVTEAEVSPDGKTFAFGLRGDIWTVAVDKPKGVAGRSAEFAKRLTEWEGDDSDFVWSKNGRQLYFTSDRVLNTRLYELDLATLQTRCLWDRSEDVSHPVLSSGRQTVELVGVWRGGRTVCLGSRTKGKPAGGQSPRHTLVWAGRRRCAVVAGSKWLAYSCRGENQAWNIWIVSVAEGKPINVTNLNAQHGQLAWSPDGKCLFFQSNRDGDGLYVLPLKKELARTADVDFKFEKPTSEVKVEIDFDEITKRIHKIANQSPQADLTLTADGGILFLSEGDVWSSSYDGKEIKRLTTDGGKRALRLSADGQTAFFIRGGELWTMKLNDRSTQEKVSFAADWEQSVRAERRAAFTQFWRSYHRGFYDPNFHGRDWNAIRRRYEPLLEAVETREEFATLLQMMVGELDASHSEVAPALGGPPSPVTPHLGFTLDYDYPGPGLKVAQVPPGAPGSYPQTAIRPGEYVLAINGKSVCADEYLFRWINDKQEREFEFLVNAQPNQEGARLVRYRVLSQDEWHDLLYKSRVDRLRQTVESRSGGKIGYLHLPSMGQSNQAQFERKHSNT